MATIRYPEDYELYTEGKTIYQDKNQELDLPEDNSGEFVQYFTGHLEALTANLSDMRANCMAMASLRNEAGKIAFQKLYTRWTEEHTIQEPQRWKKVLNQSLYEQAKRFFTVTGNALDMDFEFIAQVQIIRNSLLHNFNAYEDWSDEQFQELAKRLLHDGFFDTIRHAHNNLFLQDEFVIDR